MSNIFKQRTDFVNKPNRTTKDLSFQNNISLEVGRLTPTLIQEGLPGQSFHIDAAAGIRAMPMVFPIQTPMRFHTYFFKVPLRILCDEWEDFITGVKQTNPMPYHDFTDRQFAKSFLTTGGLGDFLGIPTSVVGNTRVPIPFSSELFGFYTRTVNANSLISDDTLLSYLTSLNFFFIGRSNTTIPPNQLYLSSIIIDSRFSKGKIYFDTTLNYSIQNTRFLVLVYKNDDASLAYSQFHPIVNDGLGHFILDEDLSNFPAGEYSRYLCILPTIYSSFNGFSFPFTFSVFSPEFQRPYFYLDQVSPFDGMADFFAATNPFSNGDIRLSAFPARAYEMVYNYFFRNEMNDPFLINGQPEYNKYLPSQAGGADSYPYHFHYRNWELDQFTSAVQSPQFGIAPLVGVTVSPSSSSADLHFGSTTVTNPDGSTTTLADSTMKVGIDVSTGKINNIVSADGVPSGNLHTIMDSIGYGISINDFRNVNSFQRYLENAIARGYKYRDQMLSHFGVDVGYPDIQVPEMIGAFSCDFNVNQINQTVGTSDSPLGDYAGQGNFIGATQRTISTYCHEHCIIIGISCLVPVPVYTQTLPKVFLRESRFDWFTPEFSKIGYQPIFNKELAPLQVAAEGEQQDGVFGYNRAWYDYLARLDEAHGLFRISLKDFIMMRQFNGVPQLGQSFLKIDPVQINDVFAVNNVDLSNNAHDDKFIGLIKYKIITQSPVPSFGQPALE